MKDDTIEVSKYMSYLLRHHPEKGRLEPDSAGWVEYHSFYKAIRVKFPEVTQPKIINILQNDTKQRFAVKLDKNKSLKWSYIRCNQGHTYPVDLGLEEQKPPKFLYHGTSERIMMYKGEEKFLSEILSIEGLSKMKRHAVHLSLDKETAKIVGQRRKGPVVIYKIQSLKMYNDGFKFYKSENNVWLTDKVLPKYLSLTTSK